jgi:uncharacterized protein (DUF4415 family)
MKDEYDFSKAKRGAVREPGREKTRITIRLDTDIVETFRQRVHDAGGGNYQTLINAALREYLRGQHDPMDEETLRRIIREELDRRSA